MVPTYLFTNFFMSKNGAVLPISPILHPILIVISGESIWNWIELLLIHLPKMISARYARSFLLFIFKIPFRAFDYFAFSINLNFAFLVAPDEFGFI